MNGEEREKKGREAPRSGLIAPSGIESCEMKYGLAGVERAHCGLQSSVLIFPEQHALFQYICFPPMGLADVITGVYLLLLKVKTDVHGNQPAEQSASQSNRNCLNRGSPKS